ncbi:hypothetical protein ACOBQX_13690 [Actinokineospora sp. G85]|uniref:hypothetical protein n=1 Tax=Actinokineospora sp. G85 TaxID=3406626 RepID=UPI003C77D527
MALLTLVLLADKEFFDGYLVFLVVGVVLVCQGAYGLWTPAKAPGGPIGAVERGLAVGTFGALAAVFAVGVFLPVEIGFVADRLAARIALVGFAAWLICVVVEFVKRPAEVSVRSPRQAFRGQARGFVGREGAELVVSWDKVRWGRAEMPLWTVSAVVGVVLDEDRDVALYPGGDVVRVRAGAAVRIDFGSSEEVSARLGRQWFCPTDDGAQVVAAVWAHKAAG